MTDEIKRYESTLPKSAHPDADRDHARLPDPKIRQLIENEISTMHDDDVFEIMGHCRYVLAMREAGR